ncbi:RAVE (regulator of V-ATPase assembly) complex subunit RAV1/DMX protein, WD repeat superfamily [Phaffia rhodozyma]|uniref:RAVE (Regulator of V-ATPase assembly) complex subunit RAV1/DMX protein, WD repeat superfamily n=1 Tax=Phaffia rhodozyma TaxID=264483 RepID=A0A0F7SQC7_PHARH|nr:RAVE (regulator of V-ATPase assembly) complex subunit RAV1/DMX protein, WD repeat superfamily [Phaffia rhodozyma]
MALRLSQRILPKPTACPCAITYNAFSYLLVPTFSSLLVLSPETLDVLYTLPFALGFPGLNTIRQGIGSLAVEAPGSQESKGIIAVSKGRRVVVFKPASEKLGWKVHSTMYSSGGGIIEGMAYQHGKLFIASKGSLALWTTDMDDPLGIWTRIWEEKSWYDLGPLNKVSFSPDGKFAIVHYVHDQQIRIITLSPASSSSLESGPVHRNQYVNFVRGIQDFWWRDRSDDQTPVLYVQSSPSTIHVLTPMLDTSYHFQHLSTVSPPSTTSSTALYPISSRSLQKCAQIALDNNENRDEAGVIMLKEVANGSIADIFVGIPGDEFDSGSSSQEIQVWAVGGLEKKQPSLLKVFQLACNPSVNSPPSTLPVLARYAMEDGTTNIRRIITLPHSSTSSSSALLLVTYDWDQPLVMSVLEPNLICSPSSSNQSSPSSTANRIIHPLPNRQDPGGGLDQTIERLIRTPNGRGLLSVGERGEVAAWGLSISTDQNDKRKGKGKGKEVWKMRSKWVDEDDDPTEETSFEDGKSEDEREGSQDDVLYALFARGRSLITYVPHTQRLSIRTLRSATCSIPSKPHYLTVEGAQKGERMTTLLAFSDIDDGVSGKGEMSIGFIILGNKAGRFWVWRIDQDGSNTLISSATIPFDSSFLTAPPSDGNHPTQPHPKFILPVDPMGWHSSIVDWKMKALLQDVIVVVSQDGDLSFWRPHLDFGAPIERDGWEVEETDEDGGAKGEWFRTGLVKTGRKGLSKARCSSRKKTAMVSEAEGGRYELSIWDSKSSDFASGLEYSTFFSEDDPVFDLDWTTTPDLQSVLAIGFATKVILLCEQRVSYVDGDGSYWAAFSTINLAPLTPEPIGDSIWLSDGSFAVGAGNQLFVYSRFFEPPSKRGNNEVELITGLSRDVFEFVALQNGPLVDYHPQLLLQCLLWNKVELVKRILVQLHETIEDALFKGEDSISWATLAPSEFSEKATFGSKSQSTVKTNEGSKYTSLFDDTVSIHEDEGKTFTRSLMGRLIEHLEGSFQIGLTRHERDHMITLVQTVIEVDEQQRALDVNGLRYLISIRFHVNWKYRLSTIDSRPTTPPIRTVAIQKPAASDSTPHHHHHRSLSFRNIVWASQSQSQEILLAAATEALGGKMYWNDAKALGVFLWIRSKETLRSQFEVIARNEFMRGEDRDPTTCSLFYFALRKSKLVQGLWKQAAWHPEQKMMLKFLGNNFDEPRWKTAALKNAFALMAKQRHAYAAAFFLLGDSLKDAVNVCIKQLDDFQLAVTLARIMEDGNDGPVLRTILSKTIVPKAFKGGHRWLGTWAFWMLNKRDLAVRILITPLQDLQASIRTEYDIPEVGGSENDDPSLALLFSQIRLSTLQTVKGLSEIPERTEFNFVLHNAWVFTRMGCHVLSLSLLQSWEFPPPSLTLSSRSTPSMTPTLPRSPAENAFFTQLRPSSSSNSVTGPGAIGSTSFDPTTGPDFSFSSFSFDPPSSTATSLPPAPAEKALIPRRPQVSRDMTSRRRSSFLLSGAGPGTGSRGGSVLGMMTIDMDLPPTPRASSPVGVSERDVRENGVHEGRSSNANGHEHELNENRDEEKDGKQEETGGEEEGQTKGNEVRKTGLGNLMKAAKLDSSQGGMDFDMGAFGF